MVRQACAEPTEVLTTNGLALFLTTYELPYPR